MAKTPFLLVKSTHNSDRLHLGSSATIGTRDYMQDRHNIKLNGNGNIDFMGVFDGHGPNGELVAQHVADELPKMVADKVNLCGMEMEEAIRQSHVELDETMKKQSFIALRVGMTGGTCAASVWIKDQVLYAANVGDSRVLISVCGVGTTLTTDHKPTVHEENDRISRSGGFVRFDRVGSILAVSRAFGDYEFKDVKLSAEEQAVSVVPTVKKMPLPENFDFIVVATDGLFDYLSDAAVTNFVRREIRKGTKLAKICDKLLKAIRYRKNSCFRKCVQELDNTTVIIAVPHKSKRCTGCPKK